MLIFAYITFFFAFGLLLFQVVNAAQKGAAGHMSTEVLKFIGFLYLTSFIALQFK